MTTFILTAEFAKMCLDFVIEVFKIVVKTAIVFSPKYPKKLIWVFLIAANKSGKALFLCGTKFKLTNNLKRATYGISFEISWLFPFF